VLYRHVLLRPVQNREAQSPGTHRPQGSCVKVFQMRRVVHISTSTGI
jgi:hypothetical protein